MSKPVKIFVEGIADVKFLSDYIGHLLPECLQEELIVNTGGWTKIKSQVEEGQAIRTKMSQNTDKEGVNLVVFDADDNFATRKEEIEAWGAKYDLNFELFLFPGNNDIGALEELLEKIIPDRNQPVFDCWAGYERCLQSKKIEGRADPLTTPAKKTKIYGYLEALLGAKRKEKEKIKERERDYNNIAHWNLDSEYLNPLKEFLLEHLSAES